MPQVQIVVIQLLFCIGLVIRRDMCLGAALIDYLAMCGFKKLTVSRNPVS